ncbi:unnamed protein product [Cuscuta epithymum]|uniref:Uncharacterized protein n=1 Tax=Cuscuta epithymum TaxID=186058 RepID=A0AAV0DQX4_9ASTE|nr:unnamed protein product [Cuscuta epithymum]CAH9139918.1 unnamed protein product [Cuscuta epithymum]
MGGCISKPVNPGVDEAEGQQGQAPICFCPWLKKLSRALFRYLLILLYVGSWVGALGTFFALPPFKNISSQSHRGMVGLVFLVVFVALDVFFRITICCLRERNVFEQQHGMCVEKKVRCGPPCGDQC